MSGNGDSPVQTTVRIILEATFHGEDWLDQANAISEKVSNLVPEEDFLLITVEELGIMFTLERLEEDDG